jgi:transcriptional regulator with XRE-family HTH domain
MAIKKHHDLFEEIKEDEEYLLEELRVCIIEEIIQSMESEGIDQAELARRIKTSRAYITKLFNTSINLTLASLIKITKALGVKISLHFHHPEARVAWFDAYDKKISAIKQEPPIYTFNIAKELQVERKINETSPTAA